MIRSLNLIGPAYTIYSRTYDNDDWKNNCIAYLDEARKTARENKPAKVLLYVRYEKKKRSLRRLAATIIASR